jgi:hypothetical protein
MSPHAALHQWQASEVDKEVQTLFVDRHVGQSDCVKERIFAPV